MDLNLTKIKKVVEYNMRTIEGLTGDFENGWKDSVVGADGVTYTLNNNLKNQRDFLAQTILDILTDAEVTVSLSTGNTKGTVTKTAANAIMKFDKDLEIKGNSKAIAGVGDTTASGGPITSGSSNIKTGA